MDFQQKSFLKSSSYTQWQICIVMFEVLMQPPLECIQLYVLMKHLEYRFLIRVLQMLFNYSYSVDKIYFKYMLITQLVLMRWEENQDLCTQVWIKGIDRAEHIGSGRSEDQRPFLVFIYLFFE